MSDDRHRLRFGLWYFDLNEVKITPAPIQRPHPPIWLGGFTPAALRRAVRYGDGFSVPDANREVYDRYVAQLTKEHRPTDNVRFASGFQWLSVSNDPEATFNEAADHILLPGQQLYGVALESWPRVRAGISPGPRALATERPSQGRRARYGDNHDSRVHQERPGHTLLLVDVTAWIAAAVGTTSSRAVRLEGDPCVSITDTRQGDGHAD